MSQGSPEMIGRYEILKGIGSGGMGTLFLARDPKIGNRHVAIKLLRDGFDNPELRERFTREADAAGALHHVNIVTIFDVGEVEGRPFIAMEYIQGETLTDLINRRAAIPLGRKLEMMEEICAGLRYAHRAGIVHRDIKPANIMIDQEGVLKILDFGIARLGSSSMTRAGMVMGTLNYMAPEQMAGQPVDARADIFAAGAVFYELLSYQRAFPGELPGIVHKIMTATREPLTSLVAELPANVVAIVDRCLEREPADRYPDMAAVRRDIAIVRQRITLDEMRGVDARMEDARNAMERGDFEAAVEACSRILALDSEHTPALELLQEARAALNQQQASSWISKARAELDRGELTAASLLVEQAVSLTGSFPEAAEVRQAVDEARLEVAKAEARAAALERALARAQQSLDALALEAALDAIDEALGIAPAHPGAAALKDRVVAALDARRRADEDARARAAVDAARASRRTGDYESALAQLAAFQPPHPIVTAALADIRAEAQEVEARRNEAQRRQAEQRRLDDERQRRALEVQQAAATIHIDSAPAQTIRLQPLPIAAEPVPRASILNRRPWQLGAAALAVLIVVGAIVASRGSSTPPSPPPGTPVAVVFEVSPWAQIDAITRVSDGQVVGTFPQVTPCVIPLPPGEYRVKASNPNFPALEFDLTVKSGEMQTVQYRMPGFDPQTEVTAILNK